MERNSGYTERLDGTSVSVNAEYAESVGKFPKMLFIKNYNLTKATFDFLVSFGIIVTKEWHHVGKNFKETDYYQWADFEEFNYENATCESGSFGFIYLDNKKTIDNLIKQRFDFKHKIKFLEKKGLFYIPSLSQFVEERWKYYLSEEELQEYSNEQFEISKLVELGVDRYDRKSRHQEKEFEWFEKTKKKHINKITIFA